MTGTYVEALPIGDQALAGLRHRQGSATGGDAAGAANYGAACG